MVVVFRNRLKRYFQTNMSGHFKLWCDTYCLHVEIRLLCIFKHRWSKFIKRQNFYRNISSKGDTVLFWLLTLEAGLLKKKIKFQPGDRAEKTSFNLVRKNWLFTYERQLRLHWCDAKGNRQPPQNHIWLIITECVGVFDLPRFMVTGTHMWPKKGVCLFIRQRIRTERSGF